MPKDYICTNCNTKRTVYYYGEYTCKKCEEKFLIKNETEKTNEINRENIQNKRYIPNRIPIKQRLALIFLSLLFLFYGIWGIYRNDLAVPLSKRSRAVFHLHGFFMYIGLIGLIFFSTLCISVIVDHYDKRNNEEKYILLQKWLGEKAFVFFVSAAILQILWQILYFLVELLY